MKLFRKFDRRTAEIRELQKDMDAARTAIRSLIDLMTEQYRTAEQLALSTTQGMRNLSGAIVEICKRVEDLEKLAAGVAPKTPKEEYGQ